MSEARFDNTAKDPEVRAFEEFTVLLGKDYLGEMGPNAAARVPSLPADGDPFLHSPVIPAAEGTNHEDIPSETEV